MSTFCPFLWEKRGLRDSRDNRGFLLSPSFYYRLHSTKELRKIVPEFREEGLRPWDVAAGVLLIEEAGGRVSRYDGSAFDIYTPPILTSNGLVHEAMMRVLKK